MDYIQKLQRFFGADDYDLQNAHNSGIMPFPGLAAVSYDTIYETDELIASCQMIGGAPICGFYSSEFDPGEPYLIIPYIPFQIYEGRGYKEKLRDAYYKITGSGKVYCLIADLIDPYSSYFEEYYYENRKFIPCDDDEAMSSKLTEEFRKGRRTILKKIGATDKLHTYIENFGELACYGILNGVFQFNAETGYIQMIDDDEKNFDWSELQYCDKVA